MTDGVVPVEPITQPTQPVQTQKPADPEEKTTFSLEYVKELRAENAKYRTKANEHESSAQKAQEAAQKAEQDALAKVQEVELKANQRIIRAELKAEAIKAGMVDLDGLKLADLSNVNLDEAGNVVGAEELMKQLKEAKPYLFGQVVDTTQPVKPPKPSDPKPFNAATATPEERAAKAREMGLKVKAH